LKVQKTRFLSGPQRAVFVPPRTALEACSDEVNTWLSHRRFSGKFAPEVIQHNDGLEVANIDFRCLLEASTQIKTAADIRWLVSEFKADTYHQFKSKIHGFDWHGQFGNGPFRVKTSSIRSRLYHESQLNDILSKTLQKDDDQKSVSDFNCDAVFVQMVEDHVKIWLSLRGTKSKQRCYITETRSQASMRAPLVAAILHWGFVQTPPRTISDVTGTKFSIWNPFCGSGVFGFEMCALAESMSHQAIFSVYPWQHWPFIPAATRSHFSNQLNSISGTSRVSSLQLEDIDPRQVEAAQIHLTGFTQGICPVEGLTAEQDFFASEPWRHNSNPLLFVANPPFGERLKPTDSMRQYFAQIGARLARLHKETGRLVGGLIITPSSETASAFISNLGSAFAPTSKAFRTGGKLIFAVRF
jgi:23S rRNA G2445 N2-methylase RlmL